MSSDILPSPKTENSYDAKHWHWASRQAVSVGSLCWRQAALPHRPLHRLTGRIPPLFPLYARTSNSNRHPTKPKDGPAIRAILPRPEGRSSFGNGMASMLLYLPLAVFTRSDIHSDLGRFQPRILRCLARPRANSSLPTFLVTVEPAPTYAPSSTLTGATRVALEPINTSSPILV